LAGLDPVILLYALQAIYSRCWPERFSCRPIERFWRLVMYGRRPVFVRGLPNHSRLTPGCGSDPERLAIDASRPLRRIPAKVP